MKKPPSLLPRRGAPAPLVLAVGLALAAGLGQACGTDSLAALPDEDCAVTAAQLTRARQTLRNRGDADCASAEAPCDDAFVLAALTAVSDCDAVVLAGATPGADLGTATSGTATGARTLHLLFESSASMNAYLAQQRGLPDHLFDGIQALRSPTTGIVEAVRPYYIGSREAAFEGDAMDFVATLTAQRIPDVGKSTSDVAGLVEAAFAKTGPADAIVLVSDFVFSPGRGVDAVQFLRKQETRIKEAIERRQARRPDFSVALVAASSDFRGTYYDRDDRTHRYDGRRPYYYLVAGPQSLVLQAAQVLARESNGETAFFPPATLTVPAALAPAKADGREGRYRIVEDAAAPTLGDAKPANGGPNDGRLYVRLHADLSGLPSPERDLLDAENEAGYVVDDVEALPRSRRPMTHEVILRHGGRRVYPGAVRLEVPRPAAASLRRRYLDDDTGGPSTFEGKTFGLQQLVEGIAGAYAAYADEPLATLTFHVR